MFVCYNITITCLRSWKYFQNCKLTSESIMRRLVPNIRIKQPFLRREEEETLSAVSCWALVSWVVPPLHHRETSAAGQWNTHCHADLGPEQTHLGVRSVTLEEIRRCYHPTGCCFDKLFLTRAFLPHWQVMRNLLNFFSRDWLIQMQGQMCCPKKWKARYELMWLLRGPRRATRGTLSSD